MNYLIGIEREGMRIDTGGNLAKTPHPIEFGDKFENPLIGTDFGEPMLELRTYPHSQPESCYQELFDVTRSALKVLYEKGELLWPYSLPYRVPKEELFPYNSYPGKPDMEEHERLITRVYGLERMCLSGIHVNFSISPDALDEIRPKYPTVPADREEAYLKCARQIIKNESAIRHFFDASPTDFEGRLIEENSLRNSPEGFRNENANRLDYSSKDAYVQSLGQTLSYERLSAIRLKSFCKENFDEGIAQHGIDRLEFRLCDIDPFDICGISLSEIKLATAIIFMCMVTDDIPDAPLDILSVCSKIDREFGLGFESVFKYYTEQERKGITKSGRVRTMIEKYGYEQLIKVALQYAKAQREGKRFADPK